MEPAPACPGGPSDAAAVTRPQPLVPTAELEEAARRIIGIHACHIIRSEGVALPRRVRVAVDAARRPAAARDIQSAWFALYGLYVPRALFVVRAVRGRRELLPPRRDAQLERLTVSRAGRDCTVVVILRHGSTTLEGRAQSRAEVTEPLRLVAHAALAAARAALPSGEPPVLLEVRRLQLAGLAAVACAVALGPGPALLGICPVLEDEHEAVVRAVLDAMARRSPAHRL